MLTIAIDFDGTIVDHAFPDLGDPIPGAIEAIKEFKALGCTLILLTMRSDDSSYGPTLTQAVEHLRALGVEFHHVNDNPGQISWTSSRKIDAHIYIDDLAAGCPLLPPSRVGGRPRVDWEKVREIVLDRLDQRKRRGRTY